MLLKNNEPPNQRSDCRLMSQLTRGFLAKRLANLQFTLAGPKIQSSTNFAFKHVSRVKSIQWNPFLTTSRIATTVAIMTDLQIPVFSFL